VKPSPREPPDGIRYGLEEALDLLAALEDSREVLVDTDHLSVLSEVEHQIQILGRRLGFHEGGPDVR
jgi:transcription initiation factor IIE alpha subunit